MRSRTDHKEVYQPGDIIVREGEETREMFVIQEGEVVVTKNVAGKELELARLGRGSFFGEMSLLESMPRNATVKASVKTRLLVIKPGSLLLTIRRDPTFAFEMLQHMSRRIRDIDERLVEIISSGKSPAEMSKEIERMRATSEFRALTENTE
ncbi:MAG: cyclic nucleotide-binding domain-containing protein [Rhodothermales bacterium]|nr:cyclic nucleotide-binding domain-containing protein [Rhodothermales bacterium]